MASLKRNALLRWSSCQMLKCLIVFPEGKMYVATTNCIGNVCHIIKFPKNAKYDIKQLLMLVVEDFAHCGAYTASTCIARIGMDAFNHNWLW